MNFYKTMRPVLFRMDAETSHVRTLKALNYLNNANLIRPFIKDCEDFPVTLMNLKFKNRVGLAAGLDKNGECIDALSNLGFGFIEIGTVTPRSQVGNPKPRMFRLPENKAIINSMGFNNCGVYKLLKNVNTSKYSGILGINIGKNANTPMDEAIDDYLIGLRAASGNCSYITINVSSPNTKDLRTLQIGDSFNSLLRKLKIEQLKIQEKTSIYTPLVVKISPDVDYTDLIEMSKAIKEFSIDGVIATNTTIRRNIVTLNKIAEKPGGLSGAPLKERATFAVKVLANEFQGEIPIIAAGGIMNSDDALEKFKAGASLVQIYTGLIYEGPKLIYDIRKALSEASVL
jgi:dihydroorotate dehydrogenase